MTVTFNRAAAYRIIEEQVQEGIEITTARIQGMARSLAPVRKTTRTGGGRQRTASSVGFFREDKRINNISALSEIGSSMGITPKRVAQLINRGDTVKVREIMAAKGLEVRLTGKAKSTYQVGQELKRLAGVRVDVNSGRAVVGGTLRKSIKAHKVYKHGHKLGARVIASAPYARYVEFPTSRTKAQPFMMPAFKAFGTAEQLAKATRR
jgi:HK97 gp10 family phage protein